MAGADLDFDQPREEEPTIYESVVLPEDEPTQEAIDADPDAPSMASALEAFVTVGKESTVDARIDRIAREIAELRAELGHSQTSKLEEAFSELCHVTRPALKSPPKVSVVPQQNTAEFADLEERVARLERRLGVAAGQLNASETPSLMTTVTSLQQKLALLAATPEHIDAALAKLNQPISQKREPSSDVQTKLYTRLQQLQPLINELPHVILRLQTLRGVHAQVIAESQNKSQLEHTLAAVQRDISEWKASLDRIESKLDKLLSP